MAGPFFFAWVDPGALPWNSSYAREDEDVFSFNLTHAEGDFPTLEVTIVNPREGLLKPSRKQWCWFSYQGPNDSTPRPVFYGRLLGVPQNIDADTVLLTFIARPGDYEEQKLALAEELGDLPWHDPVWLMEDERDDPDRVLDGRPALWHIDRITHDLTASDIITGEDGMVTISDVDGVYDSLSISYTTSPASKVVVKGEVGWNQRGTGRVDLTNRIIQEFASITPSSIPNFDGSSTGTRGSIATIGGETLQNAWPEPERRIGGGWSVGASDLAIVGQAPLMPTQYDKEVFEAIRSSSPATSSKASRMKELFQSIRDALGRSPGYVLQVIHHSLDDETPDQVDFVWVPVWRMAPTLETVWNADRQRNETVTFELNAGVQPLLTEPGEEEIVYLTLGPAYVDDYIPNVLLPSYFKTARGKRSLENLIARARAILISRARAIDVSLVTDFETGLDLSCRMSARVEDPRLPGGVAEGKIKSYRISADGDSGEMYTTLLVGCTVGRGGTIEPVPGEPEYAENGYADEGYQINTGFRDIVLADSVGYEGIDETVLDDDGQNLLAVTEQSHLLDAGASGGLVTQEQRLNVQSVQPNAIHVVDRVNAVRVDLWVEMRSLSGGPFHTVFEPTLTDLVIPKTIDLET